MTPLSTKMYTEEEIKISKWKTDPILLESGIYLITNVVNRQQYVGLTTIRFKNRWNQHNKKSSTTYLAQEIHKCPKNFRYQVIFVSSQTTTLEELKQKEIEMIISYNCCFPRGYNMTRGGDTWMGVFKYLNKDGIPYIDIARNNYIDEYTFRSRLNENWTLENASTVPVRRKMIDSDGQSFVSKVHDYGVTVDSFYNRIKNGMTPQQALSFPTPNKVVQIDKNPITGLPWDEQALLNGIPRKTFLKRINDFLWSQERAATVPLRKVQHTSNIPEIAKWLTVATQNGIDSENFFRRLKRMSFEQAATIPVRPTNIPDPLRYHYRKIAQQRGISSKVFSERINCKKMSYEEAASLPVRKPDIDKRYWKAQAIVNGISGRQFDHRVKAYHMTYEQAATQPVRSVDPEKLKWKEEGLRRGISNKVFDRRLRNNMSYEEAALTPRS